MTVLCGVPQGSVFEPILFLLYTTTDRAVHLKLTCFSSVCWSVSMTRRSGWGPTGCNSTPLRLKSSGVHLLDVIQIPTGPVSTGNTSVMQVTAVHNLEVHLDAVLMAAHIIATVRTGFAALRQTCSLRRSPSYEALLNYTLIRALVVSKLNYCNSVLVGVPSTLQHRLQSVLNAAMHLLFSARRSELVMPLPREPHCLKVPERIHFRLRILAYRCLHDSASYLADTLHLTSSVESRHRLDIDATRACDTTNCTQRPSVSIGCGTGLEFTAGICQNMYFRHCIQASS